MLGRRIAGIWTVLPLYPVKPCPPFGKLIAASATVMAPASISVISARYRPLIRSAGSPTRVPSPIVIKPAAITTTGNGSAVANRIRAATHAPIASTAPCPSETMPTRPTSSPRPSVTIE